MMTRPLGKTGFSIAPLVFGGNVFGWTIDEKTSFALLDAFVDHGFDAIDTADVYSRWAEGNQGGESETIIGRWLQARPGMRDKVKIFTKVGSDLGLPGHKGLSKAWIQQAVDDSLRRLNTDYIDLYFSHWPDPQTPVAETLEAFHSLQQAGKIRAMGASNLDAMQLAGALEVARKGGLPAWQVLQPEYNLYHRSAFEGALCDLCVSRDIGVVTYYSLASGFLTGKYRQPSDLTQSQRGSGIGKYLNPRGMRIIDTLAAADGLGIAAGHGLLVQAVELALTDELGVAGVAGDGDQLVDDGGVDGVGGDAPHLGQLVAHERAEVAGVLAAGTLKAVLDHGVVDGIGAAGDGTQNAAAAGDCVEGLAVEAALLEAVQNDIGAELRLIGDVVIGRELINRVAQGLLEQLVLILEDSDLRGRGAGVDYQNFV